MATVQDQPAAQQATAQEGAPDPTEPGVEIPEDLKDKYTRKIPKQALGLRLAHEAMCLADNMRILRMSEQVINAHNVETIGEKAGVDLDGEDMGIHVGDIVIQAGTQSAPQSSPQPPPVQTQPSPTTTPPPPAVATAGTSPAAPTANVASGISNLAKAGILAATLGAGSAIPLGISAIGNYFAAKPTAAAPEPGAWQLQLVPSEAPPTAPAPQ